MVGDVRAGAIEANERIRGVVAGVRDVAEQHLNAEIIDAEWAEGQEMSLEQAIAYARKMGTTVLNSGSLRETDCSFHHS